MELGGLPSTVMPLLAMTLTFWPNEYIPYPSTYVTKFCGEFSSNIYEDIVFTPFFGHCLLWPWPLIRKASQHYKPKYICDRNSVKFPSLVCEIWCTQGYWVIACCDFGLWRFDLIGMPRAQVHSWQNTGENCSSIYEDNVVTQFFG